MAMVSLESCYERARQSMSQGEYDPAEGICRHILQYYPQDLGAFQLLGQIHLERKESRAAREYFRRVLGIDPENISAHWGMGIAYQHEDKAEQTMAEFEQALEIKPDLADLRAQLLRLYTETYGAEQAQLRLSRAGLGRLYAKGGMLDKAIAEFREVLKQDPQRADVEVSLVDALWQRGDLEQAAQVCEEILRRLPDALKANLVLGYAHLVAGRREAAEALWRKAAACDPNNTMARVLFETAPEKIPDGMIAYGAATLPDFDEAGLQDLLAEARVQPPAPVEEPAPAPEPAPVAAEAPVAEPAGISWLDSLATGEGEVAEEEAELVPGVAPFDLGDIDLLGELAEPSAEPSAAEAEPAPFALEEEPAPAAAEELAPFDLEEKGVAPFTLEEEMAPFTLEEPAPVEAEEVAPFVLEEEEVAPFVLEEEEVAPFVLEEEEVAPFVLEEEAAAVVAEPAPIPGDQEMRPFSLEDLGLSDEEIASLEEAISATKATEAPVETAAVAAEALTEEEEIPVGLEPFSPEEEIDLGEEVELPGVAPFSLEDIAEGLEMAPPVPAEEPAGLPEVEPFSLDELVPAGLDEEAGPPEVAPFSLEEAAAVPAGEEMPDIPGLEPFSIEALGFESMPGEATAPAGLGDELKPFSLEDLGLEEPLGELEGLGLDRIPDAFGEEADAGLPAFSWQEAASSKEPVFRGQLETPEEEEPPAGPSLFEKMKASRPEVPVEEEALEGEVFAAEALEAEALEELGLEEVPALAAEPEPGEEELPEIKPFSVEAFGLEEELALEEEAAPEVAPFSLEELGLEEPAALAAKEEAAVELFSLADLGLEEAPAAGEEAAEEVEAAVTAPAEDVLRPFSLEELGLTPDEIAALDLEEAPPVGEEALPPAEEAPPVVEEVVVAVEEELVPAEEELVPAVLEEVVEEVEEAVAEAAPGLTLEELRDQVAAHPGDETMLLALARGCVAQGAPEEALDTYKKLIKSGKAGMEDTLVRDIQSWIEREEDRKRLYRLHRLLGDAYMKKGQYQQAINEYAWVLSKQ